MKSDSPATIRELFEGSLRSYGDLACLGFVGKPSWTYTEVGQRLGAVFNQLKNLGFVKGDRVALLSENQPDWGVVYLALTCAGMTVVPLLPDFSAREVSSILAHSEAKGLFISERQMGKLEGLEVSQKIFPMDTIDSWTKDAQYLQELFQTSPPEAEDLAVIIYTSGTTGEPKGVMLTHMNLLSNVNASRPIPGIKTGESMLSVLPLSHTFECTLGFLLPLSIGAQVHYLEKPPIPAVLLPALQIVKPHLMLVVPLFMEKIYKSQILGRMEKSPLLAVLYSFPPIRKLLHIIAGKKLYKTFGGRLHFFGIGGAALSRDTDRFLKEAHFPYAIGYGLTETAPLVAGIGPHHTRFRSTGPVIEGVQVKLENISRRGIGEILVKGPNVMKGYYKNPEKTAEVIDSEGWFHTGDLGRFKDQYLYITGRLKNVIIGPSGENIYPETIESVLGEFKYVLESLVFEKGGRLLAKVHLNYQELLDHHKELAENGEKLRAWVDHFLKELMEKANRQLSAFSRLSGILEQPEPFEKTPTLKIKRYMYAFI